MLELLDGAEPPKARVSEFDPHTELLMTIADRVGTVVQAVVASAGAKPQPVPPLPRPVTAIDRAKQRQRDAEKRELLALVFSILPDD